MINPDDAVMLLIDHPSGLFQLVEDIPVPELRRDAAIKMIGTRASASSARKRSSIS